MDSKIQKTNKQTNKQNKKHKTQNKIKQNMTKAKQIKLLYTQYTSRFRLGVHTSTQILKKSIKQSN